MRRPRLSSRQPMEAAATPFPREETTPPVTKMYFGPVGKALESLRWSRRTTYYGGKARSCQFDRRKNILERTKMFRASWRSGLAALAQQLFDARDIGGNIHADGIVIGFDHANVETILKP